MSIAQDIKERLDIVQYIQQFAPDLKKAGRHYKACCPFHNEKTPSFIVNPDTQTWRCFGACAEGGDIFSFAQKKNGWSFVEALRELGQLAGVEVRQRSPEQQAADARLDKLRGMLQTAADYYHQHLLSDEADSRQVLTYTTEKRGFNRETIDSWQIGFAPAGWDKMLTALRDLGYADDEIVDAGLASQNDSGRVYDRFRNRLMIPIRDERGRVVGFGARALSDEDSPKYLNSPQGAVFDKSQILFGLDKAKTTIRDEGVAVIVEGYMDVIQAHQAGYRTVVAQMGTAMTDKQLALIAPRYAKKIILGLDADEAGQNATRRSLEVARQALQDDIIGKMQVDIRVLQIDGAKDPDDVLRETPEKWTTYVADALPVADFVINLETAHLDSNASVQEKQAAAANILPILTASENNLYKNANLQKLALRLRIDERDLLAWAQELQRIEAEKKHRQERTRQQVDEPPPLPDYGISDSNHEPPPLSDEFYQAYDANEPPPYFDDDETFLPSQQVLPPKANLRKAQFNTRHSSREMEYLCLWYILRNPDWLAQVTRLGRELASTSSNPIMEFLKDLRSEDLTQADFRAVLGMLIEALNQDDYDVMSYLERHLDDVLSDTFTELRLSPEDYIMARLKHRFPAHVKEITEQVFRHMPQKDGTVDDLLQVFLTLKRYRISREQEEIRFLIISTEAHDPDSKRLFDTQIKELNQAAAMIDKQLGKRGNFPTY